ncbi:coat protein [Entoleuca phenui-like virus 1]|uniref:Nucleoprotein n=1 Tax=Entoleuca phenui-like virus 1 TaxID=2086640 RepID=A0A4D6Q2U2_9VIRU|nr:coat protein [Entoleuca phenui-like virus 1]QCF40768.1 coat protein [Entoleuca phenui-like virus 1]
MSSSSRKVTGVGGQGQGSSGGPAQGGSQAPSISGMVDKLGNKIWLTNTSTSEDLTPAKISELVQNVSNDDISKTITAVESSTTTARDALEFSIFDFQGFDPLMVWRVLRACQSYYKDSDENLLSDIRFSVAAVLYMGNLQTKALTRRAQEGRTKIEYLVKKYNIRTGSSGAGLEAETLTFPRIAAAAPVFAVKLANQLPPSAVSIAFMGREVPSPMRLMPFASLCSPQMDTELRKFLLQACNAHASDMGLAYERGRCKKAKKEFVANPKEMAEDQWAFIEVASDSPVPEESMKRSTLLELNLSQYYKQLAEVVRNYRSIMEGSEKSTVKVMSQSEFDTKLSEFISSRAMDTQ